MSKTIRMMLLLAGSITILLLAGFTSASVPGGDEFPLPPRPEPETPEIEIVAAPDGQQIQLHLENEVEDIPSGLWTVVEWQDPNTGDWYETDGWHGTLNTSTTQEWWVGSSMFGDGPFRWQLYAGEDGALLATSESFTLPLTNDLMVIVNVTLD